MFFQSSGEWDSGRGARPGKALQAGSSCGSEPEKRSEKEEIRRRGAVKIFPGILQRVFFNKSFDILT